MQPRVPLQEKKASNHQVVKTCGSCSSRRNSQPHRRVCWRDPQGLRMYTNPPTQESAPEGPNLLVGSRGSERKLAKGQASTIVPSLAPPPHTATQRSNSVLPCPGEYLRICPLEGNRCTKTKKYDPNQRTDQNSKNRTKQPIDSQPV